MDTGKWVKYGKRWIYLWERPIFEHTMQKSRADFNGEQFELYYNAITDEPINSNGSMKALGKALKYLFNADRYICTVSRGNALREMDGKFKCNVQFYFRSNELPSEEAMSKVEGIINENLVPALFESTDEKTGEVELLYYSEIQCDYHKKRLIHQECEGTLETRNKNKKRRTVLGKYWRYAN